MESPAGSDSGLDTETRQNNLASNTMEDLSLHDDDEVGTEIPLDDDQEITKDEIVVELEDAQQDQSVEQLPEDKVAESTTNIESTKVESTTNGDDMFLSARQEQSIVVENLNSNVNLESGPSAGAKLTESAVVNTAAQAVNSTAPAAVVNASVQPKVTATQSTAEREISVETDIPLEDDEDTYTSPYLELSNPSTMTSFRDLSTTPGDLGEEYIHITVISPHKVGDGMSSYMAYNIKTNTNLTYFKKKDAQVTRRFSDFLGLRDKLSEKYLQNGRIIPPAPDKSFLGMTKIKLAKEEDNADQYEFVEKRRAALERYLNRTAQHPSLRVDPDFREFLELDAELPKSSQTSTLSSKSVLKMISKVGEKVSNYTTRMEETDQWFEEKTVMIDRLDEQLRKLLYSTENLVFYRKCLTGQTYSVAKGLSALGTTEENVKLSTALDKLSEVFMKVEKVHEEQSKDDYYLLSEMIHDYIGIVGAVKDALKERVKAWQAWQGLQEELNKKREAKVKSELAGRLEKVNDLKSQIAETERHLDMSQENFEKISSTIKKEFNMFEARKCQDFKQTIVKYLERMLKAQEALAAHWDNFIPEIKQIAA